MSYSGDQGSFKASILEYAEQVTHADLTAGGMDQEISLSLPTPCLVLGALVELDEEFDEDPPGGRDMSVQLGSMFDPDAVMDEVDIGDGDGLGYKSAGPGGMGTDIPVLWTDTLRARFQGSAALSGYDEGDVWLRILYYPVVAET